ncbi:MAG: hypothetical protein PHS14_10390 [Elusimicrobia bacterium]|nr:hypothetical protein [Elusimicrobiota bacterium]
MRTFLLICAILAASARNALAIKPASQSEIEAIEQQLSAAQKMDARIDAATKKYSGAELDVKTTEAKLLELDRAVDREKAMQRAARTKAIHMTILAYDLAPANLSGTSVMRWTKDRTITWRPSIRLPRMSRLLPAAEATTARITATLAAPIKRLTPDRATANILEALR